jgi:hypothetical protein
MAIEGIIPAALELVAWAVGKVTGRTFKIDPKRAENIGSMIVLAVIAIAGIAVTLVYS